MVEFVELHEGIDTGLKLAPCWGCLGLLEIDREIFIAIVTHATPIGKFPPSHEQIHRVISVDLFCLTSTAFDYQYVFYQPTNLGLSSNIDSDEGVSDQPALNGIKKIMSNGQFYFSTTGVDLSSRTENRILPEGRTDDDSRRFSWNAFMLSGLSSFQQGLPTESRVEFDSQNFLVSVIQGFVASYELKLPPPIPTNDPTPDPVNQPITLTISLFSRLGSRRAGTRFNTRGIDDDGNVANFVESETLILSDSNLFSFIQIRGSVPLFFEQSGTGMTNVIGGLSGQGHRTHLTRTGIAAQPAFERHFEDLLQQYSTVDAINLLSHSREGELSLSHAYHERIKAFGRDEAKMIHFDLHQRAKLGGLDAVRLQLMSDPAIGGRIEQMGYFLATISPDAEPEVVTRQGGVFRVNCLDCLDRTNVIQEMLSRLAVESFLSAVHPHLIRSEYLWNCHRSLWADNGDVLSKIYAGTGALNTSFTRGGKQTFSGILSNASKSVGRMYNSNFVDKSKQTYIDLMLGNLSGQKPVKVFDPLNDTIKSMLYDRRTDYSQTIPLSIWVGTYNLNGRAPPTADNDELMAWLCPIADFEPDVLVVSFQEIVKLSPQQIMTTDPEKKKRWERTILASLENRVNKKFTYVIMRSDQLVGTALIILVKADLIGAVRSLEAKTKKTGLKGIAGNKGAVAIRLEIYDTSFCFVTAHFAAGLSNVEERNHDYDTIAEELKFLKGKTIAGHENVIWAGDFNYRIDGGLGNLAVRQAIADENYAELLAADQLLEHMSSGAVFPNYLEGPIKFAPTYKYDIGTDRYDSSEKMRIPAWTDRILYQGNDLHLTHYARAELRASDHRPVYAVLQAQVRMVDRVKKESIKHEILNSNEINNLRDSLMMPLQADHSSSNGAVVLDEWWKTSEHPDGTYEPTFSEKANIAGKSSNPFYHNLTLSPDHLRIPPPEPSPGVNGYSVNYKSDRQISSSVPSSPPAHSTKIIPPAIPARPSSRSSSQTGKPRVERPGSTPLAKKQPPPPPPRPISKLFPSKENPSTEVESHGPQPPPRRTSRLFLKSDYAPAEPKPIEPCSQSPSGGNSAPGELQLNNLPPPSHPSSKLARQEHPNADVGALKSPLLSASTSALLPDRRSKIAAFDLYVPSPPSRPVSRCLEREAVAAIDSSNLSLPPCPTPKLSQTQEVNATDGSSHNPPLPPRPISRLLPTGDSAVSIEPHQTFSLSCATSAVLPAQEEKATEADSKIPPSLLPAASQILSKKDLVAVEGASDCPALPARPTSTFAAGQNHPSIKVGLPGSSSPTRLASKSATGKEVGSVEHPSKPLFPPRPSSKLAATRGNSTIELRAVNQPPPRPPSRRASKVSLSIESAPTGTEAAQSSSAPRLSLPSPSKESTLVDVAPDRLLKASVPNSPPPVPPKPKPPKPALKPKPKIIRRSVSHEVHASNKH